MTLAKYFYKRFFTHVFFITTGITFLFSFVEFFEKIVKVEHSTLATVVKFTALNFFPTFFDSLPLSTWLATCLLIKELHQQKEWETLSILNINPKKMFSLFLGAGLLLSVFSFVGKEVFVHKLTHKAETFRMEKFKQRTNKKLLNKWFTLSEKLYFSFDYLDLETGNGSELMLIYLSDNFSPTKIIKSKTFEIDHESKNILIKNGSSFNPQNNEVGKNLDITIAVPNLHNQLSLTTQIPNFFSTLNYVYSSTLPQHVKLSMLRSLLKIFFNHFVLLLYTLLTFVLFFIAPHSLYIKWILILIPYPLITILVTLIN